MIENRQSRNEEHWRNESIWFAKKFFLKHKHILAHFYQKHSFKIDKYFDKFGAQTQDALQAQIFRLSFNIFLKHKFQAHLAFSSLSFCSLSKRSLSSLCRSSSCLFSPSSSAILFSSFSLRIRSSSIAYYSKRATLYTVVTMWYMKIYSIPEQNEPLRWVEFLQGLPVLRFLRSELLFLLPSLFLFNSSKKNERIMFQIKIKECVRSLTVNK